MLLQARGLIDIIGVQGHAFSQSEPAPMPIYRANLIASRRLGLPIHVTELDVDGTRTMRCSSPACRRSSRSTGNTRRVTGITLWGYKQNSHWRNAQGAWLVWSQAGSEGAERPAMQWIHRYVATTRAAVISRSRRTRATSGAANGSTVGLVLANDTDAGTVFSDWRIESMVRTPA